MPRVLVFDDNGAPTLTERVTAADFDAEHFRRCLCERLRWAVSDAEQSSPATGPCLATDGAPLAPGRWGGGAPAAALAE
jgi:hypothetical protein